MFLTVTYFTMRVLLGPELHPSLYFSALESYSPGVPFYYIQVSPLLFNPKQYYQGVYGGEAVGLVTEAQHLGVRSLCSDLHSPHGLE